MGLDMYLYKVPKVDSMEEVRKIEKRLSEAYFNDNISNELLEIQKELGLSKPLHYEVHDWLTKENYIEFNKEGHCSKIDIAKETGYWRKFNALHSWFVNEIQGGEDDCGYYFVDIEKLKELLYSLANISKENAEEILPTQSGFFFGGNEYDEWYFQAVENLKLFIMDLVENFNPDEEQLVYSSSW